MSRDRVALRFDAAAFHAAAWREPLAATALALTLPAGVVHLSRRCTECHWIAVFHVRGLLRDRPTVDHAHVGRLTVTEPHEEIVDRLDPPPVDLVDKIKKIINVDDRTEEEE